MPCMHCASCLRGTGAGCDAVPFLRPRENSENRHRTPCCPGAIRSGSGLPRPGAGCQAGEIFPAACRPDGQRLVPAKCHPGRLFGGCHSGLFEWPDRDSIHRQRHGMGRGEPWAAVPVPGLRGVRGHPSAGLSLRSQAQAL